MAGAGIGADGEENKQIAATRPRRKELLADTIKHMLCHPEPYHPKASSAPDTDQDMSSHTVSMFLSVSKNSDPSSSSAESTYSYVSSSSNTHPFSSSSYNPRSELHSRYTSDASTRAPSMRDAELLAVRHGSMSHIGLLDPSYSVFNNKERTGSVCFKTLYKVAVIMGDLMCDSEVINSLLSKFNLYRWRKRWGVTVLRARERLVGCLSEQKSRSIILQLARERVLISLTNSVVSETSGERILTQCRQLLEPRKCGIALSIFIPSQSPNHTLEAELRGIYDDWRRARKILEARGLYHGVRGTINGFAGLRWIGTNAGYHIDPCIATLSSRNGISDLLLFALMAYLWKLGVSYLSLEYEPLDSIDPDTPLYLIVPSRIREPRQVVAVAHVTNISL
ncbi:hypothetical protein BJX65DRAFT_296071 [Aspergillus insuetus]